MSDRTGGRTVLAVVVRVLTALGAALFCGQLAVWAKLDWVNTMVPGASLGWGPFTIDGRARVLGALGALPGAALGLYALWQLWRLVGSLSPARPLDGVGVAHLRRFAWAMFVANLLRPVARAWTGFALTLGNPPGQRSLQLGLDSGDFLPILLSAALLLVAAALQREPSPAAGAESPG